VDKKRVTGPDWSQLAQGLSCNTSDEEKTGVRQDDDSYSFLYLHWLLSNTAIQQNSACQLPFYFPVCIDFFLYLLQTGAAI
jgi:hypothetical protein